VRFFYNLIAYLLLIPFAIYWLVRALFDRTYLDKLPQRFGFNYPRLDRTIWVHAVSVGEVVAAAPLVRSLLSEFPAHGLLVTTVTPTGAERVRSLFGDSVTHAYIPFETPYAVNRFFDSVNPVVSLIVETEIWPNLYHGCGIRHIPLVLVSARISPRSVNSYRRLLPLFKETLSHGIVIAAQSEADSERFVSLGASPERTRVIGNIKFDLELAEGLEEDGRKLRESLFGERPVWIAASTHEGEEEQVLDAHRRVLDRYPGLLLVLVPRHPQRFDAVAGLLRRRDIEFVTRTSGASCSQSTRVFLGDTMGEVPLFYAASDIAFVGGSLVPVGGHNLLEPAALGLPIITGPHVFNAQEIADRFVAEDACRVVHDAVELARQLEAFLDDPETARTIGANGRDILHNNRGSLQQLLQLVAPLVKA
jgi:3-deoxy-D-manno-octulosonic-acid transferase